VSSQHFCWILTPLLIHFDTNCTIDSVSSLSDHSSPAAGFLSSRIKPLQISPPLPNHTESSSSPAQLVKLACPSENGPFLVYGILGPQFRVTNSRRPQPSLLHASSQAASRRSRSAVNRANGYVERREVTVVGIFLVCRLCTVGVALYSHTEELVFRRGSSLKQLYLGARRIRIRPSKLLLCLAGCPLGFLCSIRSLVTCLN
jgi:hypothetical protein